MRSILEVGSEQLCYYEERNDIGENYIIIIEKDNDNESETPDIYHELKRPYSLYNWELFFHTPIMIAGALSKAQQFEEAMKWFHYVFNPIIEGTKDNRFWQFAPFKEISSKNISIIIGTIICCEKTVKTIYVKKTVRRIV